MKRACHNEPLQIQRSQGHDNREPATEFERDIAWDKTTVALLGVNTLRVRSTAVAAPRVT